MASSLWFLRIGHRLMIWRLLDLGLKKWPDRFVVSARVCEPRRSHVEILDLKVLYPVSQGLVVVS
jgi:hypothetical protein